MASSINASTSGAGGVITTADSSGVLNIQTAGTTAISVDASQNVTLTNALPQASGGTGTTIGYNGFKNRIINGAMMIDQRNAGASVTPNNSYTLDRWAGVNTQTSKFTVQQSSTAPAGFKNSLLVTSSSAYSVLTGDTFLIKQQIEGLNVADFDWGLSTATAITISFWVRSSLTGTFGGAVSNSAANRSYVFTYTISSANTWEQKTVTIAGDTTGTWLTTNGVGIELRFALGSGSTYTNSAGSWATGNYVQPSGSVSVVGTNGATFYITGVQLEKGSTATSFDYRPYGTELALCQRYYEKTYSQVSAPGSSGATGSVYAGSPTAGLTTTTGYIIGAFKFTVTKRAAPTMVLYDEVGTSNAVTAQNIGVSSTNGNAFYVGGISDASFQGGRDGAAGTRTAAMAASFHFTANAEL